MVESYFRKARIARLLGSLATRLTRTGQTYWIASKLNPVVKNVEIEWRGKWLYSDDLDFWRNNSYPVSFQNHHAGFILTGDGIKINGYGTGGIDGNGDLWYTQEAGHTRPGRPFPFVFWNVSDVTVNSFFVIQPQLWSINIMNGTNMHFKDIYVNATATKAPYGTNWVSRDSFRTLRSWLILSQVGNTDGFDTSDATNIVLENAVVQTGDDCIAIKPRSYDITVRNLTCVGGNGVAIGSLVRNIIHSEESSANTKQGQYLEDNTVENVIVDNVRIIRINEDMKQGAYIKTWIGELAPQADNYESGGLPRGGGWGSVRNVLFSNFHLQGPDLATAITQDSGNNGSFAGTSNMDISNIAFVNFTGFTVPTGGRPTRLNSISCSNRHPCYGISFESFNVKLGNGTTGRVGQTTCKYVSPADVHGVNCTTS